MNKQEKLQHVLSLIKDSGLSNYEIAKGTGISAAGIGKLVNGLSKNPQERTLDIINEFINKDVQTISETTNSNGNTFTELPTGEYFMTMPLVEHEAQAGYISGYGDAEFISEQPTHSIIVDQVHKGRYVAFRVSGDSMDDGTRNGISNGSILTCRELSKQYWKDDFHLNKRPYWVIVHKDGVLFKQIKEKDNSEGVIKCHSINKSPEYQDFDIELNDVVQIFYAINVTRVIESI